MNSKLNKMQEVSQRALEQGQILQNRIWGIDYIKDISLLKERLIKEKEILKVTITLCEIWKNGNNFQKFPKENFQRLIKRSEIVSKSIEEILSDRFIFTGGLLQKGQFYLEELSKYIEQGNLIMKKFD